MIRRGAIVIGSERSRVGTKPRPWLVVQSDAFNPEHASVTVCMISTEVTPNHMFRIAVEPSPQNGLDRPSIIVVDALLSLHQRSIKSVAGTVAPEVMVKVDAALRRWLDL